LRNVEGVDKEGGKILTVLGAVAKTAALCKALGEGWKTAEGAKPIYSRNVKYTAAGPSSPGSAAERSCQTLFAGHV
jgi:hypothetical protein